MYPNIRMKIKEAVHTALWTEKMQEEYNSFMTKLKESINKQTVTLEEKALNLIKIAEKEGILVIISNAEYEW